MGTNMLDMRKNNSDAILWNLCSCKSSTVKDLAQMTGLSYATVGNLINDLVSNGEVTLGKMFSSTGGRPSQFYTFNAEYAHVLVLSARIKKGINIIHASVANLYGDIVWQTEQCFENIQVTSFDSLIVLALHSYPTINSLSFSLPGVEHNGIILTNDYSDLRGVSFTDYFKEKYNLPVIIENDVNAAVAGYDKSKENGSASAIVGIYFPQYFNPGAGIVIDGKVLKGDLGFAGEVSLLPLCVDWLAIDYENPQEVGTEIAKLISVFNCIINPKSIVLYGDFFTDSVKDTIGKGITTQTLFNIFPTIVYQSDLETDIINGLITQALLAYKGRNTLRD